METKSALLAVFTTLAWGTPCAFANTTESFTPAPKSSLKVVQSDEGKIDDDTYVVQIVSDEGAPDFLLLKAMDGAPAQISKMELVGDLQAYRVKIARDSFYLRQETAHHGIFSATYQFKKIHRKFQLVGLETQSMSSCAYSSDFPDAQNEPCASTEMWSGTSVNFLTSKAECWLQTFRLDKDERSRDWKRWKAALKDFDLGIRSGEAIRKTITLSSSALTPLDQFDLYNFHAPETCYFDYKGDLHTF
ncbi:MAG TPA: hypothetical protein VL133_14555 [Devosia sp.]|nr:hypothetical protein [Devosia sp.]